MTLPWATRRWRTVELWELNKILSAVGAAQDFYRALRYRYALAFGRLVVNLFFLTRHLPIGSPKLASGRVGLLSTVPLKRDWTP